MYCDKCGIRPATFHSKTNINGKVTETHLCEECAANSGALLSTMKEFGEILSADHEYGLLDPVQDVCRYCGTSFDEFRSSGLVGCEHCYDEFSDLIDVIRRNQGADYHVGKAALDRSTLTKDERIEELREKINQAVDREDYEEAAKLKKQIENIRNGED